jgi:V/A-type H+-transporting ATPase subunit I
MQKMSVVAHNSERSKLLRIFIKSGCVECLKSENVKVTEEDKERRADVEAERFRVAFAMNFLREMSKEISKTDKDGAPEINLKKENRLITLDEYDEVCNNDVELLSKIDEMEKINNRFVDLRAEKSRKRALREQLVPYKDLSVVFSKTKEVTRAKVYVGIIPAEKTDGLKAGLPEDAECEISDGEKVAGVAVVAGMNETEDVEKILSECDFLKANFDFECTAAEKISEIDAFIDDIDEACATLVKSAANYAGLIPTLKIVYDNCTLKLAKIEYVQNSERTRKAVVFEAWVPADKIESMKKEIESNCRAAEVSFRAPLAEEIPPTLTKNNKFVSQFDGITNMYARPNYREMDPNLFVAIYYFLFFGIMIGDAGYGLVMMLACFLFLAIKKPVKSSGKLIFMFGLCGISTLIWGILFGSWFAVTLPENSFLNKLTWFNPFSEPLKMFVLALCAGVIQIANGFLLGGISKIKHGQIAKGILSDFGWVVILIGLGLFFPKISVLIGATGADEVKPWFAVCAKIGSYVALVGLAMIFVGGAWGKKNPLKMFGGAMGSIYGCINVVGDLLSYSRLFGLGLTTCVIGYVMDMLASLVANSLGGGAAWIIGAVILLGGHMFNLAINLLGTYVHDARLQFIEFFGKFYEGGGHAFMPIGSEMKYTYLDN